MIAELFQTMIQHPALLLIALVDIALIFVIVSYVMSKFYGKKRPDRALKLFLLRFKRKHSKEGRETIEGLYEYVMDKYAGKGVVGRELGTGFRARKKILETLEGEERETVKAVFEHYECKVYGGGLANEQKSISYLAGKLGIA